MNELLTELAPSLQRLVDARLDNIDRALLSTDTSRYERRQIVSAVEDQIQELISRINRDEPTREDVLQILASLDPPEAFGTGSMKPARDQEAGHQSHRFAASPLPGTETKISRLAIVAVSLAGFSIFLMSTVIVLSFIGLILAGAASLSAATCGIVSLCQIIHSNGRLTGKGMSIMGIISFPLLTLVCMAYLVLLSM